MKCHVWNLSFRDGLFLLSHITCMRMKIMQVLFAAKCLQESAEFYEAVEVFVQIVFHS